MANTSDSFHTGEAEQNSLCFVEKFFSKSGKRWTSLQNGPENPSPLLSIKSALQIFTIATLGFIEFG